MSRKAKKVGKTRFISGSDNVFADLGLPESRELLVKVRLAESLADIIERRGLKQEEAAGIIGVDQGDVSRLVNGHLVGFSQERIMRYLMALGCDVEISIHERDRYETAGRLSVTMD